MARRVPPAAPTRSHTAAAEAVAPPRVLGPSGTWHTPGWKVADFYNAVWGDAAGRVWAVGQLWGGRKGVIHSRDFGRTWEPVDRPNKHEIRGIHGDGAGNIWAVGDKGTVFRVPADGGPWKRVPTGLTGYFRGVYCRDARSVWIATSQGEIHRTVDGGRTWTRVRDAVDGQWLGALTAAPDGTLYAVGIPWLVLRSDDGTVWTETGHGVPGERSKGAAGFSCAAVTRDGTLYAGGLFCTLVRSQDRGVTWTRVPLNLLDDYNPVTGIAEDAAGTLRVTTYNHALSSTDGTHWQVEYTNPEAHGHQWIFALWAGPQGDAVSVGAHGTVRIRQR